MTSQKAVLILLHFQNRLNRQLAFSFKNKNKIYAHCKLVPCTFPFRESNTFVSWRNAISCLFYGQVKELPQEILIPQPLWMKSKDDKKICCQGSGLHAFEGRQKLQPTGRGCQSDGWHKVTLLDKIGKTAISILDQSHRPHHITLFNPRASGRKTGF